MPEEIKTDTPDVETTTEVEKTPDAAAGVDPNLDAEKKDYATFSEDDIYEEVKNYKPTNTESDDDDIDPDDKARIAKVVEKQVGSTVKEIQKQMQIDGFFNSNPEYAKYKGAAQKYLSHPSYANLPIHNIVAIVASKDMMKIGAAKEREIAAKVAATKAPGTTVKNDNQGKENWLNAPKESFEAQRAKVLGRTGN